MEAMRAPKRRLSDIVYRQMTADARAAETGPGGHLGAATGSSAAGSNSLQEWIAHKWVATLEQRPAT